MIGNGLNRPAGRCAAVTGTTRNDLWLLVRAERRYLDAAAASTVYGAGRDEAIAHGSCRQGDEGGPVRRCAPGRRRFEHSRLAEHRIHLPIHVGGDTVEQRERSGYGSEAHTFERL